MKEKRRKITIVWTDDPEFDTQDHYRFGAEFFRILTLLVQKFLQQQESLTGYRATIRVTQDE